MRTFFFLHTPKFYTSFYGRGMRMSTQVEFWLEARPERFPPGYWMQISKKTTARLCTGSYSFPAFNSLKQKYFCTGEIQSILALGRHWKHCFRMKLKWSLESLSWPTLTENHTTKSEPVQVQWSPGRTWLRVGASSYFLPVAIGSRAELFWKHWPHQRTIKRADSWAALLMCWVWRFYYWRIHSHPPGYAKYFTSWLQLLSVLIFICLLLGTDKSNLGLPDASYTALPSSIIIIGLPEKDTVIHLWKNQPIYFWTDIDALRTQHSPWESHSCQ